jgi:hypothetical protein
MSNPITHLPVRMFLAKFFFEQKKKNPTKEICQSHSYHLNQLCKAKGLEVLKYRSSAKVSINLYPLQAFSEYYGVTVETILSWFSPKETV